MLNKRTWSYIQQPKEHEIAPCSCGNADTQWSEYEKHIWCEKCQKDFIPEHNGIFDVPVGITISLMLNITFDRFNLITQQVESIDRLEESDGAILYLVCHDIEKFFNEKKIFIDIKHYEIEKKLSIRQGVLTISSGEIKIELIEPYKIEKQNNDFIATIKFGYPKTETFNLCLRIKEDFKSFDIRKTKEYKCFKDFVLVNELNNDLKLNFSTKKAIKI